MAEIVIGKFDVLATLGTGAHSTILQIKRHSDAQHYALKIVPIDSNADVKFLEQALHEFRVGQMLDHRHLIKIYALETQRDWRLRIKKVHLLTELVRGPSLDKFESLPLPRLVQIFAQVARGLVHMHQRGVYHADMKPNNLLLGENGDVKIIDFGLSRIKGDSKERVQGTLEYMAPETTKTGLINDRTEVYNFGATMYRLLTKRLAPRVVSENGHKLIDARTYERMLKPVRECNPQVPAELCQLVHRCLTIEPHKRPDRMNLILETLADLEQSIGPGGGPCSLAR
jgi:serine/threonine protein kinase